MTSTITNFSITAGGLATWRNPGSPTAALYLLDLTSHHGTKLAPTATSYQFPAGKYAGGDRVELTRAGNVFDAVVPAVVGAPVNLKRPVIS